MEQYDNAKLLHTIYTPSYAFSEWVLDPILWKSFEFDKTIVYYNKEDDINEVYRMVLQREPCNIAMERIYNVDKLYNHFGWKYGAYAISNEEHLMPNIAIYCRATVLRPTGYKKIHVINLIGYAFYTMEQPDYIYFHKKPIEHLIEKYRNIWRKAFAVALDLKINKIKIYNVGGGAFAGPYDNFIIDIFEPAFLPLLPHFKESGIDVLGYNFNTKEFNGGFIPNILDNAAEDIENTLYVNAWDPWSLIGNGNKHDNSLDGFWGRYSNMAVLGSSLTNSSIKYRAV